MVRAFGCTSLRIPDCDHEIMCMHTYLLSLMLLYRRGYTISSSLSCGGKIPIDFEGQRRLGQHPLPLKPQLLPASCDILHPRTIITGSTPDWVK